MFGVARIVSLNLPEASFGRVRALDREKPFLVDMVPSETSC